MKIYQIYKYGGEYEDSFDYVIESYLSKEKAIAHLKELEKENLNRAKCNHCPLYYCETECDGNCEQCESNTLNKIKSYCSEYSPVSETNLLNCSNRFFNKIYFYKIVEVDVIE